MSQHCLLEPPLPLSTGAEGLPATPLDGKRMENGTLIAGRRWLFTEGMAEVGVGGWDIQETRPPAPSSPVRPRRHARVLVNVVRSVATLGNSSTGQ